MVVLARTPNNSGISRKNAPVFICSFLRSSCATALSTYHHSNDLQVCTPTLLNMQLQSHIIQPPEALDGGGGGGGSGGAVVAGGGGAGGGGRLCCCCCSLLCMSATRTATTASATTTTTATTTTEAVSTAALTTSKLKGARA